jgi:hypothetical protein
MALDDKNGRIFVAARRIGKLIVLNISSGVKVDERSTVDDADDIWYDAARKRIYVSGADGVIDIVLQKDADTYEPFGKIESAPGAKNSLLVPEWNRFFVAAPKRGTTPAAIRVYDVLN